MTFDSYQEAFSWMAEKSGMTVDEYDAFIKEECAKIVPKTGYQKRPISYSTRTRIFCRDLHECQYCGARDKPLCVDHIIPEVRGGSSDDDNLTTACRPCNGSKGARTPEEWRGDL